MPRIAAPLALATMLAGLSTPASAGCWFSRDQDGNWFASGVWNPGIDASECPTVAGKSAPVSPTPPAGHVPLSDNAPPVCMRPAPGGGYVLEPDGTLRVFAGSSVPFFSTCLRKPASVTWAVNPPAGAFSASPGGGAGDSIPGFSAAIRFDAPGTYTVYTNATNGFGVSDPGLARTVIVY